MLETCSLNSPLAALLPAFIPPFDLQIPPVPCFILFCVLNLYMTSPGLNPHKSVTRVSAGYKGQGALSTVV